MAELSLNDYGRAASDAIAGWKRDVEQSRKKLDTVCRDLQELQTKKKLTPEETQRIKECTRLRDGLRGFIVAESRKLDDRLRGFKLKKDTDTGAFGKVQGKLGTLVKEGLPLSEHFSLTLKPLKLDGGLFIVKGKF